METASKSNHIGRKISRLRELRDMKQEALAIELGISQQAVSKLEQSADIEDEVLEKVAKVLGFPVEAIKNFDEEKVIYNIQNVSIRRTTYFQPGLIFYSSGDISLRYSCG